MWMNAYNPSLADQRHESSYAVGDGIVVDLLKLMLFHP